MAEKEKEKKTSARKNNPGGITLSNKKNQAMSRTRARNKRRERALEPKVSTHQPQPLPLIQNQIDDSVDPEMNWIKSNLT